MKLSSLPKSGLFVFIVTLLSSPIISAKSNRLNLLLVTVDDMSCDSVGVYGCKLEGITPTMDRLASQSLRFEYAHVTVGNCNPCRNVMFSGLISHNNKVEGFYKVPDPGWPHMVDLLQGSGYYAGIHGKVSHSSPYQPYVWDDDLTISPTGKKGPTSRMLKRTVHPQHGELKWLRRKGNLSFYRSIFQIRTNLSGAKVRGGGKDPYVPSRIYTAEEVPVPGFLFEDPEVREEIALYYSSVRRADDCLNEVLKALRESGLWDNTMIIFLSDHGMPLPFAKTQLYHHSTRTPLMVRLPGVTQAGKVERGHMVSILDLLPTVLDSLGVPNPKRLDGLSFLPLLRGEKQENREFVIKEYHENAGRSRDPMRAIQSKTHLYLFNPWSNGERIFRHCDQWNSELRAND